MHLISKTYSAVQNLGAGAKTADHWARKYVWGASVQRLDCLLVEEVTQPLSLEGVSQMVYTLSERLLALVRPAFDLVLRRIRSLKRCVEA